MSAQSVAGERTCPGERSAISRAICRTRQRNQYPKCLLCPHRSARVLESTAEDPKVSSSVFRTGGVLGRVPDEINEYVIRKVGLASAQFLRAESPSGSRLVVGCDARKNSRGFTRILSEGINSGGVDALNLGLAPPELLGFVLSRDGGAGAAFVGGGTYADNVSGVRLWRADGSPLAGGSGLEKVGMIARRLRTGRSRLPGQMSALDPVRDYVAHIEAFAGGVSPLKVLVDGGCGAGGGLVRSVFEKLPVEVAPVHFEEDGRNPFLGHRFPCNALLSSLKGRMAGSGCEFGAALDFTGERIAFCDERGERLGHDVAAAMIATELLAREPGLPVVYDLRSTAALRARVTQCKGTPVAAPTAATALADEFRRSEACYAADLTGLHCFKGSFGFASPVLALLLFCGHVSREQRPVSELAAELDRFRRSGEVVISTPTAEAAEDVLARMKDEFRGADRDAVDGVTIRLSDWWFNLRRPGHGAELRLNVEGRTDRDLRRGRQTVERLVSRLLSERGA